MQSFAAPRAIAPGRAGLGNMAGRAGVGARRLNPGNFARGSFRSFGNTGFGAINRANPFVGGNRINNFNRVLAGHTNVNVNRFNNFGGNLGYRGFGYGWRNPYYGYHRGWINGFWGGFLPWGFGWGYPYGYGYGYGYGGYGGWGLGYGPGWGLSNWLYGSALYGYGYSPYSNPYYNNASTTVVVVPYDYSQPINTLGPPPAEPVTDEALALFGAAREAFKQGDFATALQRADDALARTPNDTALHEFRALCLFALGRYDEAATPLYAVLAIGPGWDWPTLSGLYPGVDAYTTQLRALEAYCKAHPQSATGRFVLAYQYLTEGYLEAAAKVLRQVVALKPDDTLSAKLLRQLEAAGQNTPGAASPPAPEQAPAPVPADTTPPEGATISGTWNARPGPDPSIALTIEPGGAFTWRVTRQGKGQTQPYSGSSTFGAGVLTLAQDNGPALVGRVTWKDPSHMTFRIVGGEPTDPGLSFTKEGQ
jgi:hypothetical protein